MADHKFVTTDHDGRERRPDGFVLWELPSPEGPAPRPSAAQTAGAVVELLNADALLDRLDERIFLAEPVGSAAEEQSASGVMAVSAARLVAETPWDPELAAAFALDCVEHAFADELDLELPKGRTLGAVVSEARAALERAGNEDEGVFAALARYAMVRRLRRTRELLGSTAAGLAREDEADQRDLLDDPAWATLAA
ncbi:MAG: hypothetical protein JWM85_3569, partial [Acidimicrobiaceae bacterium]|nr:hypothetical protein [Acidimicrobiaceae bacterium]